MSKIKEIIASQIKDSKGRPTVEVELTTEKGSFIAACPSGVSTGEHEALELRDENGGVLEAIENVNNIIAPKLRAKDPRNQKELDDLMVALDGTQNKSKLGANAILPVSLAICRAGAAAEKLSLYAYIAKLAENKDELKIPFPSLNILEGGAHAANDLDVQEFMVVCQKKSFQENIILANGIFNSLNELIRQSYGEVGMGDEGGFAPPISKTEQALYLLKSAIGEHADAKIAIDVAASEFYKDEKYILEGKECSRGQMIDFYKDLAARFPIISIEDPFAQDDWEGFKEITQALGGMIVVGDDLTTTNLQKIKEAQSKHACNGVILKINQIGTVSETIEAAGLAKSYGWKTTVSHRAGETMDSFIADLAVGVGTDFIKSGSPSQPERMVKYNRLLEVEKEIEVSKKSN